MGRTRKRENPRLLYKVLANGMRSYYLEFYLGSENGKPKRKKMFLGLKTYDKPTESWQQVHQLNTVRKATEQRDIEAAKMMNQEGYEVPVYKGKVNLLDFMDGYISTYDKRDIRNMKAVRRDFARFLAEQNGGRDVAFFAAVLLTEEVCDKFAAYLRERSRGEGAKSKFARFRKMLKAAVADKVLLSDPTNGKRYSNMVDCDTVTEKATLDSDEYAALLSTPTPAGVSEDVCRAFTFCLFTGLRFCDVSAITFGNIVRSGGSTWLSFKQRKTKNQQKTALDDNLLTLIGNADGRQKTDRIFELPSYCTCLKQLDKWVKAAGINKHITWHCARHSVGTLLAVNGAPLPVIASVLGHASLKMSERYIDIADRYKAEALSTLNTTTIHNFMNITKTEQDGNDK